MSQSIHLSPSRPTARPAASALDKRRSWSNAAQLTSEPAELQLGQTCTYDWNDSNPKCLRPWMAAPERRNGWISTCPGLHGRSDHGVAHKIDQVDRLTRSEAMGGRHDRVQSKVPVTGDSFGGNRECQVVGVHSPAAYDSVSHLWLWFVVSRSVMS